MSEPTNDLAAAWALAQLVLEAEESLAPIPDAAWNGVVELDGKVWADLVDKARAVRFQRSAKVPRRRRAF